MIWKFAPGKGADSGLKKNGNGRFARLRIPSAGWNAHLSRGPRLVRAKQQKCHGCAGISLAISLGQAESARATTAGGRFSICDRSQAAIQADRGGGVGTRPTIPAGCGSAGEPSQSGRDAGPVPVSTGGTGEWITNTSKSGWKAVAVELGWKLVLFVVQRSFPRDAGGCAQHSASVSGVEAGTSACGIRQ